MIDVHCHLDHFSNWEKLLSPELDVVITAALGSDSIEKTLKIEHEKVRVTAGCDCRDYESGLVENIRSIADRLVGIGEVGLDWYPKKLEDQIPAFKDYISLAQELDIPIVVHSRSAGKHALDVLYGRHAEKVVMHAFDGKSKYAVEAARRGYLFSIPPSVVRSPQKKKLVEALELESLLLESDAPALGPVIGEKNVPANVALSASEISKIKGIDMRDVIETTDRNAKTMFRL